MKYWGALLCFILSSVLRAQTDSLIISEVMFYSVSGNNEYIELYNLSNSSIDLHNFRIKYYTSAFDSITSAGYGTVLKPHSYAVVLEGDYDFTNGIYKDIIPPEALKLKITSNAFGSNGMANTTSRPLWLLSRATDTLDYYFYSADNQVSISDEKNALVKDTSAAYWKNSVIQNGTPGFRNSVQQYVYDVGVKNFIIIPERPLANDDVELAAHIRNYGMTGADYIFNFYNDLNKDSIPSPNELIFTSEQHDLNPGDSILITTAIYNISAGTYSFIAEVLYPEDEFLQNNFALKTVTITEGTAYNSIIINEIMYAPMNKEPEWIELYNNTDETINLRKWKIGDAVSAVNIANYNLFIPPYSWLVIARDSSVSNYYPFDINFIEVPIPAYNNTGDAVFLKDTLNLIVDSLYYFPVWGGGNNKSLERISPLESSLLMENWGTSKNIYRATPGFKNSLTQKNTDAALTRFCTQEVYGIVGEEVNFVITVNNKGLLPLYDVTVLLSYDRNCDSVVNDSEIIREFFITHLAENDSVIFTHSYSGYTAGINCFTAHINNDDEDIFNNTSYFTLKGVETNVLRNDIIVNEIMYAPIDEPEWLELYNCSNKEIDIKGFLIADRGDTVYLMKESYILPPDEYLVVCNDSSLLQKRNIPSQFLKSSVPSLNNTGDRIMIIDSLHRIIDSLEYSPLWGGKNGCSIERISFFSTSEDSCNWSTSLNKNKGTPGYINSVAVKQYDVSVEEIITNPHYPVTGDTVGISVKIRNKGSVSSVIILNLYSDTDADSLPDVLLYSTDLFTPGMDSVLINNCYTISGIYNSHSFFAELLLNNDQDTSNNYLYKSVKPGYRPETIIINEVLYSPSSGEPEWIELYNCSSDTINLKDWRIKDVHTTPAAAVIKKNTFIKPFSYIVITPDTSIINFHRVIPSDIIICSIPNLNNDADGVILSDERGVVIDSMYYNNLCDGGRSLERISASASSALIQNWGVSKDIELSTPGRINSIAVKDYDIAAGAIYIDPRYPAMYDTICISAVVRNLGSYRTDAFDAEIYTGTPPDTLLYKFSGNNLMAGDSLIINSTLPFIISHPVTAALKVSMVNDADEFNNYSEKKIIPGESGGCIVINEIMYDPPEGQAEWIELYNPSGEAYNLKDWSISDVSPAPVRGFLSDEDRWINPGEYIVISTDSSLSVFYPSVSNIIISKFGSLSAGGDGVMLYDYRDGIIDSMKYLPAWGGRKGRSLERKSYALSAADSSNWMTSLSPFKATPGEINSLIGIPVYNKYSIIINEIMYDPGMDNSEFIELYNRSDEIVNIGGWRIEDESGNYFIISDTNFNIMPGGYFLFAADSSIMMKYSINDLSLISIAGLSSLGLSNSGERIKLADINSNIIDSVYYAPGYHNGSFLLTKNRSLERINPEISGGLEENWSSSVADEGATPGRVNSVFTPLHASASGVAISPNPFSPDNDGWEDHAIISYNVKTQLPQIRIKIYDGKGRLVRTLADNKSSGSDGSIIFDGRDDEGRTLRIGIYILFLEAAGATGTESYKSAFVIARKL
jgi:hypothetical protein